MPVPGATANRSQGRIETTARKTRARSDFLARLSYRDLLSRCTRTGALRERRTTPFNNTKAGQCLLLERARV